MRTAKHQHICPGCFKNKGQDDICRHCGFDEKTRPNPIALPYWTLLNRQYLTGRVLGKLGGFGITYLAWDTRLDIPAAVKEYLPRDFAGRDTGSTSVSSHSEEDEKMFRYGLKLFLSEAKTLAKFDHPNIVRVRNVFENNGTAYLVMDYLEGESMSEYLHRKRGRMDEALALEILLPVLDGLEEVHRTGFLHRDIKPHNLYLAQSGRTILLDFGAARQAIGENSRSRSVMLTPGYAPFEQYHRRGNQGPWTDVYACAAVLYHMVTGVTPPESTERIEEDSLIDPREINPKLSAGFAETLLQGLALQAKDRPQSVAEFRNLLASPAGVAVGVSPGAETVTMRPGAEPTTDETTTRRARTAPPAAPPSSAPAPAAPRKWELRTGTGLVVLAAIIASYPLLDRLADKLMRRLDAPAPQVRQLPAESSPQADAVAPEEPSTIPKTPAPSINPSPDCPYCPKMVWIAGGEFWMGAADGDGPAQADEQPRHKVRVEDFPLGQYEVTQGQWQQVMGDNPSLFALCGDNCPVENVSWIDAQAFIEKLNQLSGLRCRLPTEAEWEYACRSGGREQRYCGGDNADAVGWHEANAKAAHPVGAKLPNALGLYDMSGNVSEWTSSLYQPYPYQAGDGREQRLASGQARVLRGGFWGLPPERSRATARNSSLPDLRNFDLGLRLVCFPPIGGQ